MASYLHHTATTIYLCCVPALEDSTGAGCVGLATAKILSFYPCTRFFLRIKTVNYKCKYYLCNHFKNKHLKEKK